MDVIPVVRALPKGIAKESVLPVRYIMLGVIGFVVAAILSVIVVQHFEGSSGDRSTTPPDPLVVAPEKAAEQNP